MPAEKDLALLSFLIQATKEGKIPWEPTARQDEFTVSLKGKFNVLVKHFIERDGWEQNDAWSLTLFRNDNELTVLTNSIYADVRELFEAARRYSLNVDEAIDEIIEGE
jgi:beta-xylosidase